MDTQDSAWLAAHRAFVSRACSHRRHLTMLGASDAAIEHPLTTGQAS